MAYEIIGVVGVIVGVIIGIATPILKLNSTINTVIAKIEEFERRITRFEEDRRESNRKIWTKLDEHGSQLSEIKSDLNVVKSKMDTKGGD